MSAMEGTSKDCLNVIREWDGTVKPLKTNVGAVCAWFEFEKNGSNIAGVLKEFK